MEGEGIAAYIDFDYCCQFHQTLANGEKRKAKSRQKMAASQFAQIFLASISPTNFLMADFRQKKLPWFFNVLISCARHLNSNNIKLLEDFFLTLK